MDAAAPLRVVAAVIEHDGRVLACRRNAARSAGGLWEFPGGKIEPGETPEEALRREIFEELGIRVEVGELLHRGVSVVERRDVDLLSYRASPVGALPVASTDHDLLRWMPLARLSELEWSPADRSVVGVLVQAESRSK